MTEAVVEKEGKKLYKVDRKYIDASKTNKYKLYLKIYIYLKKNLKTGKLNDSVIFDFYLKKVEEKHE